MDRSGQKLTCLDKTLCMKPVLSCNKWSSKSLWPQRLLGHCIFGAQTLLKSLDKQGSVWFTMKLKAQEWQNQHFANSHGLRAAGLCSLLLVSRLRRAQAAPPPGRRASRAELGLNGFCNHDHFGILIVAGHDESRRTAACARCIALIAFVCTAAEARHICYVEPLLDSLYNTPTGGIRTLAWTAQQQKSTRP